MVRLQVCIKEINVSQTLNQTLQTTEMNFQNTVGFAIRAILFSAQFSAEFPLQVMNFPLEYSTVRGQLTSSSLSRYILL